MLQANTTSLTLRGLWHSWWGSCHNVKQPVQFGLLSRKGALKSLQDGLHKLELIRSNLLFWSAYIIVIQPLQVITTYISVDDSEAAVAHFQYTPVYTSRRVLPAFIVSQMASIVSRVSFVGLLYLSYPFDTQQISSCQLPVRRIVLSGDQPGAQQLQCCHPLLMQFPLFFFSNTLEKILGCVILVSISVIHAKWTILPFPFDTF